MINTVNIFFFSVFICTVIHGKDLLIIEKSDHDVIDRDDNLWYIKCMLFTNTNSINKCILFFLLC
jgi:hypothetical protein